MRRLVFAVSFLAALAVPLAAHAASLDLITITGPSGTYTLTVPSAPTPAACTRAATGFNGCFELAAIPTTGPGIVGSRNDAIDFFDTAGGGGLWDQGFAGDALNFVSITPSSLLALGHDNTTTPIFALGSGTLDFFDTTTSKDVTYSYTTTQLTPEPSSLLLLGTGGLGLIECFRRRVKV